MRDVSSQISFELIVTRLRNQATVSLIPSAGGVCELRHMARMTKVATHMGLLTERQQKARALALEIGEDGSRLDNVTFPSMTIRNCGFKSPTAADVVPTFYPAVIGVPAATSVRVPRKMIIPKPNPSCADVSSAQPGSRRRRAAPRDP
jgi:hypothetical protein